MLTISFQDALFHRKQWRRGIFAGGGGGYNFIVTEVRRQVLQKAIDIFFVEQIPPYVSNMVAYRRGVSTFAIPGVERTNEWTNECKGDCNRSREIVNSYIKGRQRRRHGRGLPLHAQLRFSQR